MFRWQDRRLALPSARGANGRLSGALSGQGLLLRDKIWVPHVYLSNERESVVMGAERKDVRIILHPDGRVEQALRYFIFFRIASCKQFQFRAGV